MVLYELVVILETPTVLIGKSRLSLVLTGSVVVS